MRRSMDRIEWWETLFSDVGAIERRAINQAAQEIGQLGISADVNADQIRKLFELDKAQHDEIERLRLTVKVLTEVLLETGAVAREALEERMTAAFVAYAESKKPPPKEKAKPNPKARCQQCASEVPIDRTNLTTWGLVCDACYQKL